MSKLLFLNRMHVWNVCFWTSIQLYFFNFTRLWCLSTSFPSVIPQVNCTHRHIPSALKASSVCLIWLNLVQFLIFLIIAGPCSLNIHCFLLEQGWSFIFINVFCFWSACCSTYKDHSRLKLYIRDHSRLKLSFYNPIPAAQLYLQEKLDWLSSRL